MKKISLVLLISQILVILFVWRNLPPQLPLFYSRPHGEEQLTTPQGLFILPGISLIVILTNSLFSSLITKEQILIRQILASATFVFNLLCLVTLIQIIRLVI